MSDVTAPVGGAEIVSVPAVNPASNSESFSLTPEEAGRQLSQFRWKRDNPAEAKAAEAKAEKDKPEAAPVEAAPDELAETPDDAQPEAVDPVEATETPEPAEPPIERPRSWTKDEDAEWQSLPRAMQQKIVAREQERDTGLRRSQNEAAEKLKGLTAKEQAVEQARQQYESALPALYQTLLEQQQGEFADIKSWADAEQVAVTDPVRAQRWQIHQGRIAQVASEVKAAQERQVNDFKAKWSEYASTEDRKAVELMPEFADESKQADIGKSVLKLVEGVGFTKEEFGRAWIGEASISPRDHRWQQILVKAAKYDQAKSAKPAPKPVPPVQKPGVSKAPVSASDAQVEILEKRFDRTGNPKDAAALLNASRRARA